MKLNVFDESWKQNRVTEYEADPLNPEKALGYVLVYLSDSLEIENRIENEHIFCPDFNMSLIPRIGRITEKNIILNFALYAPQWGRELFESSIGVADSPKQAVSVAVDSFLFTFVNAVSKMEAEGEKGANENIATIFAGKTRNWNVYFSDVAATGDAPDADADIYWDKLKKPIIKRLGNQKICYVKIYVAKAGGKISAECRIDSILCEELCVIVAKMAEQWAVNTFASHQMFFCIRQDDSTVTEYPYFCPEGKAKLKSKVKTAVDMIFEESANVSGDSLLPKIKEKIGDGTLAAECLYFLPEICAEHAFSQVKHADTISIAIGERKEKTYYKVQIADYWQLHHALFELFNEGAFGKNTNEIYKTFVDKSAIKNAIMQLEGKKTTMKNISMSPLTFRFDEDFTVR
ncbi:MAG: hypothetical protein HDT47_09170 [Ruminococcaceae bacterium]|nr:hypothetical protein [Oscillospiraceae bacterium]